MTLYSAVLVLHSNLRWVVLVLGAVLVVRALLGWARRRAWGKADNGVHVAFIAALDVELLLGLLLYVWLSPWPRALFGNMGAGMGNPVLRFFGIEHALLMIVAVTAAHVGRVLSKKAKTDRGRHGRAWMWTLGALVLMLAGIPWPGLAHGRPLARWATGQSQLAAPAGGADEGPNAEGAAERGEETEGVE